jgi:hypothetical protein
MELDLYGITVAGIGSGGWATAAGLDMPSAQFHGGRERLSDLDEAAQAALVALATVLLHYSTEGIDEPQPGKRFVEPSARTATLSGVG